MKNRRPHGPLALVLAFLVACSPILIATSAQEGLSADALEAAPLSGQVFDLGQVAVLRPEPSVNC